MESHAIWVEVSKLLTLLLEGWLVSLLERADISSSFKELEESPG